MKNGYTDVTLVSKLWKQVDSPLSPAGAGLPKEGTPEAKEKATPFCGHCRLPALHVYLNRGSGKTVCPFKDHTGAQARKAAPALLQAKIQHPTKSLADLVQKAIGEE